MGYEGKGIITEECHALVHNLVVAQVGVEHIEEVIHLIANTLGIKIDGTFDPRSIGRIVLEGGIASIVQGPEYVATCKGSL